MNIEQALQKIAQAEILLAQAKQALQNTQSEPATSEKEPEEIAQVVDTSEKEYDINTINGLVSSLLSLAVRNPSDEDAAPVLDKITHVTIDTKALASLMRFNWSRLKSQVQDYLISPNDPESFTIVREQDRSSGNIDEKKLFLSAKSRNPVPLTLRKDTGEEHWRIYTFSL